MSKQLLASTAPDGYLSGVGVWCAGEAIVGHGPRARDVDGFGLPHHRRGNGGHCVGVAMKILPEARFTIADPRIEPEPNTGCWLWKGVLVRKGYGAASIKRDGGWRTERAHRLVWERLRGPIPEGLVIDHMCRVRCCVNPDHLRAVTPRQNALENSVTITALNAAKRCCPSCGGEYRTRESGKVRWRVCVACQRAGKDRWRANNVARRNATRRAAYARARAPRNVADGGA